MVNPALYEDLIGVPFIDGGRDPKTGLDCCGLVMELYRRFGHPVEDYKIAAVDVAKIADTMANSTATRWGETHTQAPGSVVLIRLSTDVWANHAGVCLGNGRFIHAYTPTGVCIDRLKKWESRIVGYYRPARGDKK